MIRNYSDHAANERTFLAWQRTGLSIAAFGFVIQRFNLFLAEFDRLMPDRVAASSGRFSAFITPFGHYDGFALALVGVAIVIVGAVNFVRTSREIDRAEVHTASMPRFELMLSGLLVLLASAFCVYLALQ
jgi:putative membrane protein